MSLIGSKVRYVDIADDIGGHGTPPGCWQHLRQIPQFVANRRAAAICSTLKKERGRAGVLG
jgi:hypothetical protein